MFIEGDAAFHFPIFIPEKRVTEGFHVRLDYQNPGPATWLAKLGACRI